MSESLQESINNMKELFEKRMAVFEAELPRSQASPSLTSLASEYQSFKAFVIEALNGFQRQVELLSQVLDTSEMRSRRKMLLLHGVPEEEKEDTAKVVTDILKKHITATEFSVDNIRRCHRMGRSSGEHKPRPIAVKFTSQTVRDNLWYAKTKFKGSGVTVSEFLTKQRHEAFMAARQRFGLTQCWTKSGFIFVMAPDGTRRRVSSIKELNKIELKDTEKPSTVAKQATKLKRAAANKK